MSNKILIIGAGVAGMSAGIYAQQSGFDVTILEQHTIPGGNCTSWKRNGYLFEGALHWLTGSSNHTPLNQVWRNVGVIDDHTNLIMKDCLSTYYDQDQVIHLYRDPDQMEQYFTKLSPEDSKEVKALCKDIKAFMKVSAPVMDIPGVKVAKKSKMTMSELLR
ncbi:MAG: amine oxidase [Herbinix sp.]|jgi:phytoene dehydrogenase-like protein|nr:amine oxidase [Herbinix sp.]